MKTYNDQKRIIEHYDLVSPYYHSLWGKHLHHGYWITGKETKEEAQLALTKHLVEMANIKSGKKILDVGCGFGASSIYLAKNYNADTIGITISSIQVDLAQKAAAQAHVGSRFLLMDAEAMTFEPNSFDIIWSIESISHYKNKEIFFRNTAQLLKQGGTVAVIDWFKKENLSADEDRKYITPIEKGMLVELRTMDNYVSILKSTGLEILKTENLNKQTSKTWDISLDIIKDKTFWRLALEHGSEFVNFLKAFRAMKNGFLSGNFVYGLIIAKKP